MKIWNNLMVKYHRYMWCYYSDQRRAKSAFIALEKARHCERLSELYKLDPFDRYLVDAELNRWSAFWDVQFAEECAIGDKMVKHHQKQMKYQGIV